MHRNLFGLRGSLAWLAIITGLTAVVSSVMVQAIKGAVEDTGMSSNFVCAIIIPIAGNAAEHGASQPQISLKSAIKMAPKPWI